MSGRGTRAVFTKSAVSLKCFLSGFELTRLLIYRNFEGDGSMSNLINVNVATRADKGKGASRRLRRENLVPAILYGAEDDPQPVQLKHNEVVKHLENDAFYSQLLMVSVDGGEPVRSLLRDVQRHPFRQQILHMDFQRVVAGAELTVTVPIQFINEDICAGVKVGGGIINHIENELTISCLPRDIPEFLQIDMENVEVGQTVSISDIVLPEGVKSVDLVQSEENDRPVAAVAVTRATVEEDETTEGEEEGAEGEGGDDKAAGDAEGGDKEKDSD